MSTRCFIAKENSDGSFRAAYSHWDGYPSCNGKILLDHYSDHQKLDALLDEGSISILRKEIGEKHDFDAPLKLAVATPAEVKYGQTTQEINEWTTFYGRDRGEENIDANSYNTVLKLVDSAKESWANYLYVFTKEGIWRYDYLLSDELPDSLDKMEELTLEACEA